MLRHYGIHKCAATIISTAAFLLVNVPASAAVRYVKWNATGANNGTSWTDAFLELQWALTVAVAGDEIWVAAGTYKPDYDVNMHTGDRSASFFLKTGVGVYGGFSGTETVRSQRNPDPDTNGTILSGDLNGNDGPAFTNNGENSYHVVTADYTDDTAVLDGFTITAGYANGDVTLDSGGGLIVGSTWGAAASPKIANCAFRSNWASDIGGGVAVNQSGMGKLPPYHVTVSFTACTFASNHAAVFGGGLYTGSGAVLPDHPTTILTQCSFIANSASRDNDRDGGGVFSWGFVSATECTFIGNTADGRGGALRAGNGDVWTRCAFQQNTARMGGAVYSNNNHPTLVDCTLLDNSAAEGGALYLYGRVSVFKGIGCVFRGNTATSAGGAVYIYQSSPILHTCWFGGNSSENGGAVYSIADWANDGNPLLVNCVLTGNTATNGAAICAIKYETSGVTSNPAVVNCSLSKNVAQAQAGGVYATNSALRVTNSIVWANSSHADGSAGGPLGDEAAQITVEGGTATVRYNDIQGLVAGGQFDSGENIGNIGLDPLFLDSMGGDGIAGTWDDNLDIPLASPCVDAGENAAMIADTLDLDGDGNTAEPVPIDWGGHRRFVDATAPDTGAGVPPIIDMGAYEYQSDCNDNGVDDYTDIVTGTSYDLNTNGNPDECDPLPAFVRAVDISAQGASTGLKWTEAFTDIQAALTAAANSGGSITEIWVAEGTYTPAGPNGSRTAAFQLRSGLGVYGGFAAKELTRSQRDWRKNVTILSGDLNNNDSGFTNNSENSYHVVTASGANESAVIDGFVITGGNANATSGANSYGAGMTNSGGKLTVANCMFRGNAANLYGGGMYNASLGDATVANCVFSGNLANSDGAGMYNVLSNPILSNCTFAGNRALHNGGGMHNFLGSSPTVTNCTFSGNSAAVAGGGMYMANDYGGAGSPTLTNCVFWGDAAPDGPELALVQGPSGQSILNVSYCNVQGGQAAVSVGTDATLNWGDANRDASPSLTPDGHLRASSSECIGRGTVADAPAADRDDEARPHGVAVDIGCDEFIDADSDGLPDWWEQQYPTAADADGDPDGDGLTNLQEYELLSSDPTAPPYYVDVVNGDDTFDGLASMPQGEDVGPKKTIQAALALAGNGDTIAVLAGTYSGAGNRNLDYAGKSIVVHALGGPAATTIDCGNTSGTRAVNYLTLNGAAAALDGFTITGGNADYGGAIRTDSSRLILQDCVLAGNTATNRGGGIYSSYGTPAINGLTIEANTAPSGQAGAGVLQFSNVNLVGDLAVATGRLDVLSAWFYGAGAIDLAPGSLLNLTGTPGAPATVLRSRIGGRGDILINAGQQLRVENGAVVDLSGSEPTAGCGNCPGSDPSAWGTVTVNGTLVVSNATIKNTNVLVTLANLGSNTGIINNDIRLAEATTGYGGQFFVDGSAHIECNRIVSEGDRYLDLDPDPSIPLQDRPLICDNRIYVEIKEGILGSKGTVLECRTQDQDAGVGDGQSGAYLLASSTGYSDTWVLQELKVLPDAKVNLTNRQGFEFNGSGVAEALYVKKVVLHPGAVLNTGLQRLYYQELVDETNQPLDPVQPLPGGRRIVDEPLLGFSLGLIAMDDDTEFGVRIRKRERDSGDDQPCECTGACLPQNVSLCKEGSVGRLVGDSGIPTGAGGVMDLRTQAVNRQPASSVAAKGAFARAGKEEILIAFQYLFVENPEAELVVYLSDDPDVAEENYEIGRLRPPSVHRAGGIGSGRFGIWQKRVSSTVAEAHGLNFTSGVYVEVELVASQDGLGQPVPSRIWLDNFDPAITCGYICGDLDEATGVTESDFLLLLAEMGQAVAGQKRTCLDLSGDGYVDLADVLPWGAHFEVIVPSLCLTQPTATAESLQPTQSRQDESSTSPRGLIMAGRQKGGGGAYWADTIIGLDQNRVCQDEFPPAGGVGSVTNGRLVLDNAGVVHQIGGRFTSPFTLATGLYCLNALDDDNDNICVVAPHRDIFMHPGLGSVYVDVDLVAGQDYTFPLSDAVFSPKNDESGVVYVVPVVVDPAAGQAFEPFCAAARLALHTPRDGGYTLQAVYGLPDAVNSDSRKAYPREIEISPDGEYLFVASAYATRVGDVAETENDYLLVYDTSQSGAPVKEIPLWNTTSEPTENPAMLSLPVHGPTSIMVSRRSNSVYCAAAVNAQNPASTPTTRLLRFARNGADLTFAGAADIPHPVPGGYTQPTFTAMITAITEDPVSRQLWVAGYSAPYYDAAYPVNQPPFGDDSAPLFTLPTLARISPDDVSWSAGEPVTQLQASVPISCQDSFALPVSLVFNPSSPADFDSDGDVDDADLLFFEEGASGPAVPVESGFEDRDLDGDSDVDQADFAVFQRCFSGPDVPADPDCAD
ncbi:MAG: hypothetical protein QUV05_04670 [Phycisphaerae bacterium]|nr:hypothetical protein [Phycisphaerae bacterium]